MAILPQLRPLRGGDGDLRRTWLRSLGSIRSSSALDAIQTFAQGHLGNLIRRVVQGFQGTDVMRGEIPRDARYEGRHAVFACQCAEVSIDASFGELFVDHGRVIFLTLL